MKGPIHIVKQEVGKQQVMSKQDDDDSHAA